MGIKNEICTSILYLHLQTNSKNFCSAPGAASAATIVAVKAPRVRNALTLSDAAPHCGAGS